MAHNSYMSTTQINQDTCRMQHLSLSDSAPVAVCGSPTAYNFHMGFASDAVIDSSATCPDCRNAIRDDE
jgi:phage-related baseplate assembly protein